jgi:galactokinase
VVALAALADHPIGGTALARLGQRVENDIVGVRSGIMDQLAIALGVAGHGLLIDCRTLRTEPVPIPPEIRILVLDSAVPRALAGSAYNQRRSECEAALGTLQTVDPNLHALRDVTADLLHTEGWRLTDVQRRRARHVVTANQRVLDFAAALRRGDTHRCGQLLTESHHSLRADYQVSGPELDTLVDIATHTPGVLGSPGSPAQASADAPSPSPSQNTPNTRPSPSPNATDKPPDAPEPASPASPATEPTSAEPPQPQQHQPATPPLQHHPSLGISVACRDIRSLATC